MSFREKSAWISLISILVVSGFFFLHVPWNLTPSPSHQLVRGMLYCIIALVIIEVVAHLVVAMRAPEDAQAPRDERERLIDLKATRVAHYVYVVGSLLALTTLHLGANAIALGFRVLLAFVIGQVVNYAARIVYHRGGI